MSSSHTMSDSIFQTPGPLNDRKRVHTPASVFNFRSHKKRRMSMGSTADWSTQSPSAPGPIFQCENASTSSLDRFIPLRPPSVIPLTISPRTNRMYKSFGLLRNTRLNYRDENTPPSQVIHLAESNSFNLLRKSASTLFPGSKSFNGCSVTQNLAKAPHPTLILDSPGLTTSLYSKPLSWSVGNQIAVACGQSVYYQDLSTKVVSLFFTAGLKYDATTAVSIAWGDKKHQLKLACINDTGRWELFEVGSKESLLVDCSKPWMNPDKADAKCLAWNGDLLTLGMSDGEMRFQDIRESRQSFHVGGTKGAGSANGHRKSVVTMAWNTSRNYLASGDVEGNVHIWDVRTQKTLTEVKRNSKIRHQAAVKDLAWCSWKPDLLATGSYYPEGIVQVWSTNKLSSGPIEPEKTLPINAAVHSLIWSPHCKELLSVHGVQFEHEPATHRQRRSFLFTSSASDLQAEAASPSVNRNAITRKSKPTIVPGPLTHSILVHDYPSGKRLLTLSRAHHHSITATCLGPNGREVFTASPKEETIKMWRVWGEPPERPKETPFASCVIR